MGVADLHITVGEEEAERFQKQQDDNRVMKRKVFERLDVDLSEPLAADKEESSIEAMTQRKMDDFMADGMGRVGAYHAVQKWLKTRTVSTRKQYIYLWYEKTKSEWILDTTFGHVDECACPKVHALLPLLPQAPRSSRACSCTRTSGS